LTDRRFLPLYCPPMIRNTVSFRAGDLNYG
jgi:hypothetical protein